MVSALSANTRTAPRNNEPAIWAENIHPLLHSLMAAHINKYKRVMLNRLLKLGNMTILDLPRLDRFVVEGRNNLCYNWVLGRCTGRRCNFIQQGGHAPADQITQEFAQDMASKLSGPLAEFAEAGK